MERSQNGQLRPSIRQRWWGGALPRRASRSAPPCSPRPGFANRWSESLDNVVRASCAAEGGQPVDPRGVEYGGEADDLGVEGRDGRRRGDESVAASVIMTVDTPDVGTAPGVAPSGAAPAPWRYPRRRPDPRASRRWRRHAYSTSARASAQPGRSGLGSDGHRHGDRRCGPWRCPQGRTGPTVAYRKSSGVCVGAEFVVPCGLRLVSGPPADWRGVIGDNVWGGGPTGHGVSDYRAG